MSEHIKAQRFAEIIHNGVDESTSLRIREHLAECSECTHFLLDMISVADLDALDLLPALTEEEEQRAHKALSKLLTAVRQTADKEEGGEPLVSKVKIGLWLEEVSKTASSCKRALIAGPTLKLLQPIAEMGFAAFMPNAMAMRLSFSSVTGTSISALSDAAHAIDQVHGFLVEVLSGNILRFQITDQAAKKFRVRLGNNIAEHEVPKSGTIEINLNTFTLEDSTNWLTDIVKKKTSDSRGLIMEVMEIELLKD